jgi:hypothetical protein
MTKLREKPPDEVEEEPAPKLDIVHTTQTMMYHAKEETICEDSRAAAKKKKQEESVPWHVSRQRSRYEEEHQSRVASRV